MISALPGHQGRSPTGGIIVAIVGAVFPLKILADLVNVGTLAAFVIVCAAVMVMRRRRPDLPRRFARRSCRACRSSASPRTC